MLRLVVAFSVAAVMAAAALAGNGLDPGPWPMTGRDGRRSQQSDLAGPRRVGTPRLVFDPGARWPSDWDSPQMVVSSDGRITLCVPPGEVAALDATGAVHWRFSLAGPTTPGIASGFAVTAEGMTCVAVREVPDIEGAAVVRFYALRPDGTLLWSREQDAMPNGPAIAADGTIYQMDEANVVRAHDPSGRLVWVRDLPGYSQGAIALDSAGNLYVGTDGDPSFWSLDPTDGSVRFSASLGPAWGPVVAPDDTIYVANTSATLYALRPDGTRRFLFPATGEVDVECLSVDGSGAAYLRATHGLFVVDRDGRVRWTFHPRTPPSRLGLPAILDRDGVAYVCFGDDVHALRDGAVLWQLALPGAQRLVLGAEGVLYVVTTAGTLFAIESPR